MEIEEEEDSSRLLEMGEIGEEEAHSPVNNDNNDKTSALRGAPRELWLMLLWSALEAFSAINLPLYLTADFGYNDLRAGEIIGVVGLVAVCAASLSGLVVDVVGLRLSLRVASLAAAVLGAALAFTHSSRLLVAVLLVVTPIRAIFQSAAFRIAIVRFTPNESARTVAFALQYSAYNLGLLASENITTLILAQYPKHHQSSRVSALRVCYMLGAATALACVLLAFLLRDVYISPTGRISIGAPTLSLESLASADTQTSASSSSSLLSTWHGLKRLIRMPNAYRVLVLSLLLSAPIFFGQGVRNNVYPKYIQRQFHSVLWSSFRSLNPLMCVFLVPLFASLTRHVDHFSLLVAQSTLYACSTLILCATTLSASVPFFIAMTIAEIIGATRFTLLVVALAPKPLLGTFLSLSTLPLFLDTLVSPIASGLLLDAYCPPPFSSSTTANSTTNSTLVSYANQTMATAAGLLVNGTVPVLPLDTTHCIAPSAIWLALFLMLLPPPLIAVACRSCIAPPSTQHSHQQDLRTHAPVTVRSTLLESLTDSEEEEDK